MGFNLFDKIMESSTTTGTTSVVVLSNSAPSGHKRFGNVFGDNDTTYYVIQHRTSNQWEVGLGTYTTGLPALERSSVIVNSTGDSITLTASWDGTGPTVYDFTTSTSVINVGWNVSGASILPGTTVASIVNDLTITLSQTPSGAQFQQPITFTRGNNPITPLYLNSGIKDVFVPLPANKWQGTTNSDGTYANRPTTGIPGKSYWSTNSAYDLLFNDSSTDHYVYGYKVTEPVLSQWTVVNESPMTTTSTRGGIAIQCSANATVHAMHYYYKNCPGSTPWSCEFAWLWQPSTDHYTFPSCGFRENSTGRLVSLLQQPGIGTGDRTFYVYQWTDATTFGSAEYNGSPLGYVPSLLWVKLQDNGTNRIFSISNDGQLWYEIWSVSRTTWLTGGPTAVFFGLDPYNRAGGMHLVHYREY